MLCGCDLRWFVQENRPDSDIKDRAQDDTGRADDRFSAAPTALGSSSGSISQPFRAGLTFGGRPSGPCIYGDLCPVISPLTCRRLVSCSG
jgi:hypothetical protein